MNYGGNTERIHIILDYKDNGYEIFDEEFEENEREKSKKKKVSYKPPKSAQEKRQEANKSGNIRYELWLRCLLLLLTVENLIQMVSCLKNKIPLVPNYNWNPSTST